MTTVKTSVQALNGLLQRLGPTAHRCGAGEALGVDSAQIYSGLNDESMVGVDAHGFSVGGLWAQGKVDSAAAKANVAAAEAILEDLVSGPAAGLMVQGPDVSCMPDAVVTAGFQGRQGGVGGFGVVVVWLSCHEGLQNIILRQSRLCLIGLLRLCGFRGSTELTQLQGWILTLFYIGDLSD